MLTKKQATALNTLAHELAQAWMNLGKEQAAIAVGREAVAKALVKEAEDRWRQVLDIITEDDKR